MTNATADTARPGLLVEEDAGPLERQHLQYANYPSSYLISFASARRHTTPKLPSITMYYAEAPRRLDAVRDAISILGPSI
jgi:hypothetical protein